MKIEIIDGKFITKERPDNNYKYLKTTNENFRKLSSLKFLDSRVSFKIIDNDRQIGLDLPALNNPKTINEPALKVLIDCMTIYGFNQWRYRFEKPHLKSKFNAATAEIADYQQEIERLDAENEALLEENKLLKLQLGIK